MSASEGPRELELKLSVADAAALERIAREAERRGARRAPPLVQHNHLFDSRTHALRSAGFVLRLREEVDGDRREFTLTAKGRLAGTGDDVLHARSEEEATIDAEDAARVLGGDACPLERLADALGRDSALVSDLRARLAQGSEPLSEPLMKIGAFTNTRTVVGPLAPPSLPEVAVALELDRTELPDGTESFEVELELPAEAVEPGRALLGGLLRDAGVDARPAGAKSERFAAALERLARRDAER